MYKMCRFVKLVAFLSAEANLDALYVSKQQSKTMRLTLQNLGHKQPPFPTHINNTTVVSIVNNDIKCQHSCAFEMMCFWLLDAKVQRALPTKNIP